MTCRSSQGWQSRESSGLSLIGDYPVPAPAAPAMHHGDALGHSPPYCGGCFSLALVGQAGSKWHLESSRVGDNTPVHFLLVKVFALQIRELGDVCKMRVIYHDKPLSF